jgi:hypothetical protein
MKENKEGRERNAAANDKDGLVTIVSDKLPKNDPTREREVTRAQWEKLNAYEKKRGSINWKLKENDSDNTANSESVTNTDQQ